MSVSVLPVAHVGLDGLLPSRDDSYKIAGSILQPRAAARVHVRFGKPLDFAPRLEDFESAHTHLEPLRMVDRPPEPPEQPEQPEQPEAEASPAPASGAGTAFPKDFMCAEKRALYREITDTVRGEIIRLHAIAREKAKAGAD